MKQEDLELRSGEGFNPASCLTGPEGGDLGETHHCIQVIDPKTWAREDLWDTPRPNEENVFLDGSSRVMEGEQCTGYNVEKGRKLQEGEKLLCTWSAQTTELYALVKAH